MTRPDLGLALRPSFRRLSDALLRWRLGRPVCLARNESLGAQCALFPHGDLVHQSWSRGRNVAWDAAGPVHLCGPDGRRATPEYAAWVAEQKATVRR